MPPKAPEEKPLNHREWLRWLFPFALSIIIYSSDSRYVKKEELTNVLKDIARNAEASNTRLAQIEKTQAIIALQSSAIQDHEQRLRELERKR